VVHQIFEHAEFVGGELDRVAVDRDAAGAAVEADRPAGVRYVRDVDLLAVLELAPSFAQVPDLFEAYCRRAGPVALPDFLYALATAVARRWLVAE